MSNGLLIDFSKIIGSVKKRMGLILVVVLISGAIGGYFTFVKVSKPVYQVKASIIIGDVPSEQTGESRYYEMVMNQNLISNYVQIAKSNDVLNKTINKLNSNLKASELQQSIVVTPLEKSSIINLELRNQDGNEAVKVLKNYVEALLEVSKEIYPAIDVKVLNNPSSFVQLSSGGRSIINLINALIIGFFVSLILVFILDYLEVDSKKKV